MSLELKHVAKQLNVDLRTLFRWISAGLPSELRGRCRYVDLEQARAWLRWKGLNNPAMQHLRAREAETGNPDAMLTLPESTRVFSEWLAAGGSASLARISPVLDSREQQELAGVFKALKPGDEVLVRAVVGGIVRPPLKVQIVVSGGHVYTSDGHLLITSDGHLGERIVRKLLYVSVV